MRKAQILRCKGAAGRKDPTSGICGGRRGSYSYTASPWSKTRNDSHRHCPANASSRATADVLEQAKSDNLVGPRWMQNIACKCIGLATTQTRPEVDKTPIESPEHP